MMYKTYAWFFTHFIIVIHKYCTHIRKKKQTAVGILTLDCRYYFFFKSLTTTPWTKKNMSRFVEYNRQIHGAVHHSTLHYCTQCNNQFLRIGSDMTGQKILDELEQSLKEKLGDDANFDEAAEKNRIKNMNAAKQVWEWAKFLKTKAKILAARKSAAIEFYAFGEDHKKVVDAWAKISPDVRKSKYPLTSNQNIHDPKGPADPDATPSVAPASALVPVDTTVQTPISNDPLPPSDVESADPSVNAMYNRVGRTYRSPFM